MTEKSPASSVHTADQLSPGSFETAAAAESHAFVADRNSWQQEQQLQSQLPSPPATSATSAERNDSTKSDPVDRLPSSESESDHHKVAAAMTRAVNVGTFCIKIYRSYVQYPFFYIFSHLYKFVLPRKF